MPALLPDVDPDGLLEYSVVYTDRALNHMSKKFQGVMRDLSATLKQVYHARSAIVVPGPVKMGGAGGALRILRLSPLAGGRSPRPSRPIDIMVSHR